MPYEIAISRQSLQNTKASVSALYHQAYGQNTNVKPVQYIDGERYETPGTVSNLLKL